MTITKLFAVVVLSACEMATPEAPIHNTTTPAVVAVPAATPRTLRNGRPACGNIASRAVMVRTRCRSN